MKVPLLAALTFLGAVAVLAQNSEQNIGEQNSEDSAQVELVPPAIADQVDVAQSVTPASSVSSTPAYIPLTVRQKYVYSIEEIFGPGRLVALAAYAAVDQMGVRPVQWGSHPDSLAIRFASYFGNSLVKHNLEFGVRAVDHEDPRYFRSGRGRPWTRLGYAVVHTFVVHDDRGGWMPAYSLAAADYGTPYLVRRWRPERFQTASVLQAGTFNVGVDIGTNILREFWPDMRNALPSWLTRNNPLLPAPVN